MPIKVKENLPAIDWLKKEGIFVMTKERAEKQDIRPLKLLILNLMPNKEATELQLLRLISQTSLQINIEFLRIKNHEHRNTNLNHLNNFYLTFDQIKHLNYDALIITGAPIETIPFDKVDYWQELTAILDWAKTNVTSSLFICWGAQAALFHYYDVPKIRYNEKLFGVYAQKPLGKRNWLLNGFDDIFYTPQSRYTGIDLSNAQNDVKVIAKNSEIGETIIMSKDEREIFVLGHFEYDTFTLRDEYERDLKKGLETQKPFNYSISDEPLNCWRSHSYLFYRNWINRVYQKTPYNIEKISQKMALPPV